jgi:hypothetical protein
MFTFTLAPIAIHFFFFTTNLEKKEIKCGHVGWLIKGPVGFLFIFL